MNTQPKPADFALALYETAQETHQRKDWRQACHALASALKGELLRTTATAARVPMPADAPKAPASPKRAAPKPVAASGYVMTAESLTAALRLLCRAVHPQCSIPILSQVLMQAKGGTLKLSATDLNVEIVASVEARGIGDWLATCDARALLALLSKGKGEVTMLGELTTDYVVTVEGGKKETRRDSKVTITGAVNATLKGCDPGEFPVTKAQTDLLPLKIAHADLVAGLTFVAPAISSEENRYYLNGAYITRRIENGLRPIEIIATDGSRLNLIQAEPIDDGGGAFAKAGAIVPHATVGHILALLKAAPLDAIAFSPTHCQIVAGPVVITSRLVDGHFPDYWRVIPKADQGHVLAFDSAEMLAALAKVSAISKERSKSVRLNLTADLATLTVRNYDGAESSATVPCGWSGANMEVSFNADFLAQSIKALGCETLKMAMGGPNDPARIQDYDPRALERLCVAMPLRN